MVRPIAKINVVPDLPPPLERLRELAYNLRFSWDHETIILFRRLDADLWEKTGHNPVHMLGLIDQERLEAVTEDSSFMAQFNRVLEEFDRYLNETDTWFNKTYTGLDKTPRIAYFSMEYGLTECFQNYSGGLGILSGDHLKSASDLGIPLIAVGLLYQEGYFHQYLNADGYQQESYPVNDFANLPLQLITDDNGEPIKISVPLPGRELYAIAWKVQVGRIPLYLLDTNIDDNPRPEDRNLTDRLYGGDKRTRIRQEILFGIGGIRLLDALDLRPDIYHMNEGHAAFLSLERIRQMMQEGNLSFEEARILSKAGNIFTTHTPVPAGLERFGYDLIDEHFTDYFHSLGLSREQFIDLGRERIEDYELFSLPVLALRVSAASNGVAKLHGHVSRHMWQWNFPQVPAMEVPIGSVTNGIHILTWLSREMATLYDRYLDPNWRNLTDDENIWQAVRDIPDAELWRTHERRRERLVAFTRRQLRQQLINRGAPQSEVEHADEVLNPDALTIGFARRFATYKRATLFMRDLERLTRIALDNDHPVQFIFAGKAHPHDTGGKDLIREIDRLSRTPEFRDSLVFLEDYDINSARYMYQGVDVWMNNPRRPKEASGTSGMKVLANGGLNFSILDGWWAEGYSPAVGWAIGNGEEYSEAEWPMQDQIESEALYNILEQDIVPLFYTRGRDGLPRAWIEKMKESIVTLTPYFNTRRMVSEYTEQYYMPNYLRKRELGKGDKSTGKDFVAWRNRVGDSWGGVSVGNISMSRDKVKVGSQITVHATVRLGELQPSDVQVQLYFGQLDARGDIADENADIVEMKSEKQNDDGSYQYTARIAYESSGERGMSVRVLPHNPLLATAFLPGLITWAS